MVEFALLLPVFLVLVVGIIQFGMALNYWLDGQRVASQGARWATVNNWPSSCQAGSTSCNAIPACNNLTAGSDAMLQQVLYCELLTKGERNTAAWNSPLAKTKVSICFPAADPGATTPYSGRHVGDPVRVTLERPFNVIAIPFLGGFGSIKLRSSATMRLEASQDAADSGAQPLITGYVTC